MPTMRSWRSVDISVIAKTDHTTQQNTDTAIIAAATDLLLVLISLSRDLVTWSLVL